MARRRMIDPNFWQSEDISKLTIRQRLLFIGLFSNADDEGKLRGNPAFIRSIVFPYEDFTTTDVEKDLKDIEEVGSIIQYTVDDSKYILIVNWKKFQRVDKPQRSVIPNHNPNSKNESKNDYENDYGVKESKLVQGSLEEESIKVPHSAFNDPIKDRIFKYGVKCEVKNLNILNIEDIFFFIDKLEIDVIEEALKKSHKMYPNYAVKIMNDWLSEGKIKLTLIKGGQPNAKRTDGHAGRTNAELDAMSH